MSKTKKLTSATVPMLTSIPDTALVAVFDPTSGVVSKTDFVTLKQAVRDSIHIGGRNLLLTEAVLESYGGNCTYSNGVVTATSDKDTYFGIKLAVPQSTIIIGGVYTLSFDCNGLIAGSSWIMQGAANKGFSVNMVNGRNSVTFTMVSELLSNGAFRFDDGKRSFPNGFNPITLYNFKLEEGNMATAWSPAPEDKKWGGGKCHYYNLLRNHTIISKDALLSKGIGLSLAERERRAAA